MDFKFRRESITANNDTAPVNGIGLNTPDGVKYLSGESGALQFGGEAIGGGGGFQVVTVDLETETCSHSASEIVAMMQTAPVFVYIGGSYILPFADAEFVAATTLLVGGGGDIMGSTFIFGEDKSVTVNSI